MQWQTDDGENGLRRLSRRHLVGLGVAGAGVAALGLPFRAEAGGVTEKSVNLDIARRAGALLRAYGVEVVPTRTRDVFVSLGARTQAVHATDADLFVSIHNNAGARSSTGTEVYRQVSSGASAALAASLVAATRRLMDGRSARSIARSSGRDQDRDYYAVLRTSPVPAVIFEGAYLSNPSECRALTTESYRQLLASVVAAGVVDWAKTGSYGRSSAGEPAAVDPGVRVSVPALPGPTGLAGVAPDWRAARLSWAGPAGAPAQPGVRVWRDGTLIADLEPGTTAFTDRWVRPGRTYRYEVRWATPKPGGANAVLESEPSVATVIVPLKPLTVVLDPGHGGKDPGAIGTL